MAHWAEWVVWLTAGGNFNLSALTVPAAIVATAREFVFLSGLAHASPPEDRYALCGRRACARAQLSSEVSFSQHSLSSYGRGQVAELSAADAAL